MPWVEYPRLVLTDDGEEEPPADGRGHVVVCDTHEGSHLLPPHVNKIQVFAFPDGQL